MIRRLAAVVLRPLAAEVRRTAHAAAASRSSVRTSGIRLQGKVCLVTGGGTGIGRGIAEKFASEGAKVVVSGLVLKECEEVAAAITQAGGVAIPAHTDVTDEQMVANTFDLAARQFGRIDCVVANAGIQIIAPIQDFSYKDYRRLMSVHVDGSFLCTREAFRHMIKQTPQGGSIVYIGSVHSKEASPLKMPYVTAKHGIIGMCRAAAKEGGQYGIRANVVCPGFVLTALVEKQIPEQAKALGISEKEVVKNVMLKGTVDGEFTTVDDVAEAALFFAAHPTAAMTGQSMIVSHGWHME